MVMTSVSLLYCTLLKAPSMSFARIDGRSGRTWESLFTLSQLCSGVNIRRMASWNEQLVPDPVWVSLMAPISTAYLAILAAVIISRVFPKQLRREMGL